MIRVGLLILAIALAAGFLTAKVVEGCGGQPCPTPTVQVPTATQPMPTPTIDCPDTVTVVAGQTGAVICQEPTPVKPTRTPQPTVTEVEETPFIPTATPTIKVVNTVAPPRTGTGGLLGYAFD